MIGLLTYTTRVVIVKPARIKDRHKNDRLEYDPEKGATLIEVDSPVAMQPMTQTEDMRGREMTVTGWQLVTLPGNDIPLSAADRVRFDGREAEVMGQVARYPHPIIPGAVHHAEARVQEVAG